MKIILIFISPLAALIFSPLFSGIINKVKAFISGRKGQPLLQVYYNLFKLFKKGTIYSSTTSWIFRISPVLIFTFTLAATAFIPVLQIHTGALFKGDFILMLYLLGISRFFLIISAMDTGSAFEGMGASREAFFSALVEPVMFICLINIMKVAHTDSLAAALLDPMTSNSIAMFFSAIPLFILLLVENARIPFDDPSTHLELTMIHEVMILDNSGPSLGMLEYAASIKLWLFSLILALLVIPELPFGLLIKTIVLGLIMIIIAIIVGIIESIMARSQLFRIPQIIFGAGVISFLGFFIITTDILVW